MKYIVKKYIAGKSYPENWGKDSEFETYEEARKRCLELVGDQPIYTEPSGEMKEGFFGNQDDKDGWICRIEKVE